MNGMYREIASILFDSNRLRIYPNTYNEMSVEHHR